MGYHIPRVAQPGRSARTSWCATAFWTRDSSVAPLRAGRPANGGDRLSWKPRRRDGPGAAGSPCGRCGCASCLSAGAGPRRRVSRALPQAVIGAPAAARSRFAASATTACFVAASARPATRIRVETSRAPLKREELLLRRRARVRHAGPAWARFAGLLTSVVLPGTRSVCFPDAPRRGGVAARLRCGAPAAGWGPERCGRLPERQIFRQTAGWSAAGSLYVFYGVLALTSVREPTWRSSSAQRLGRRHGTSRGAN